MMTRKKAVELFIRYIHRFGFFAGFQIYLKRVFSRKSIIRFNLPSSDIVINLRNNSSDGDAFDQVFLRLQYDNPLNFTPRFIIDCGANVGMASLFFHKKFPHSKIVAVEPEKSNYDLLVKNVKEHQEIEVIKAGIFHKNAELVVENNEERGNWGFTIKESKQINNSLKAITVDDIMKEYGQNEIDILKMDIEGSELEVFSENYHSWLSKTNVIMIELHDSRRKGCSKAFFKAISDYDFSVVLNGETIICTKNH